MFRLIDLKTGSDDPSLSLQIVDITMDPNSIDCNQIKRGYLNDPTMLRLAQAIQKGWPETGRDDVMTSNHILVIDWHCT